MVDVTVTIDGLSAAGLGEARVNERPLLVRNALPGEEITARILKKRKGVRFADGTLAGNPHPHRVASVCSAFPRCGGCNLHHLAYDQQLQLKEQQLRQALRDNQVTPQTWRQPQSAARIGYRTKARLGVRRVGDQVLVGFRESFSSRVARLGECLTLTPALSRLLLPLREVIAGLAAPDKIPQLELAQGDDGISVIVRHLTELTDTDLACWRDFEHKHHVQVVLQSAGYDSLRALNPERDQVQDRSYQLPRYGLSMHFQPHQFTQVNQPMNQRLIDAVTAYLQPVAGKRVLDLFCGIGNFTLPLARHGAQAVGLEASSDAVRQAQVNADLNRVSAGFEVADLYDEQVAPAVQRHAAGADALVLDPPRSGAGPQFGQWLQVFQGDHVIYVSCHPGTFAQDAAALQNAGFVLREVGVYDMFPHTAHIETLGCFVRA